MHLIHQVAPAMPSNVLSLLELKDLSTSNALLTLLSNAKVMRFSQILQLLPQKASTPQAEILRFLQQIAVVIRGCWVVKSEVLYPEKFCSRHSGVAASLLCRGRDYMLWKVSLPIDYGHLFAYGAGATTSLHYTLHLQNARQ